LTSGESLLQRSIAPNRCPLFPFLAIVIDLRHDHHWLSWDDPVRLDALCGQHLPGFESGE
jgi:hypothetical protein